MQTRITALLRTREKNMPMYEYRRMSKHEREEVLAYRRFRKLPLHEPPHFSFRKGTYIISAACFEHRNIIESAERQKQFQKLLLSSISELQESDIRTWVIMPNHYHILLSVDLEMLKNCLTKIHRFTATSWNREDKQEGRKVWFRFSDRRIRNEKHFFASVNYIHSNPVRHDYVKKATDWACSGIHLWVKEYGLDYLRSLWREYPVLDYGKDWDE
jgi:putative transposase